MTAGNESSSQEKSLHLDFPPQNRRLTTVATLLVAFPVAGLLTVMVVRLATGIYLLENPREVPFELIAVAALVAACVVLLVRWLQGMRDPGPARVTWSADEFVEWRGDERRVVIPRSEARQYLGELHVSYQNAGGSERARRIEGRVCQISYGKGKFITICDGERPIADWLDHWRCHAGSLDKLVAETSRLPKAGETLERDERARTRHDSRIFVLLGLLGYVGVVIGLAVFAAPSTSTDRDSARGAFLAILVAGTLLLLRSFRPLMELLSRGAAPRARRSAALELALRLAMIAVVGCVAVAAVDRVVKSGPYRAPYPRRQ